MDRKLSEKIRTVPNTPEIEQDDDEESTSIVSKTQALNRTSYRLEEYKNVPVFDRLNSFGKNVEKNKMLLHAAKVHEEMTNKELSFKPVINDFNIDQISQVDVVTRTKLWNEKKLAKKMLLEQDKIKKEKEYNLPVPSIDEHSAEIANNIETRPKSAIGVGEYLFRQSKQLAHRKEERIKKMEERIKKQANAPIITETAHTLIRVGKVQDRLLMYAKEKYKKLEANIKKKNDFLDQRSNTLQLETSLNTSRSADPILEANQKINSRNINLFKLAKKLQEKRIKSTEENQNKIKKEANPKLTKRTIEIASKLAPSTERLNTPKGKSISTPETKERRERRTRLNSRGEVHTYQPRIDPLSNSIIKQKRESTIDVGERLQKLSQEKKIKLQNKIEEERKRKEILEAKECTFKPEITKSFRGSGSITNKEKTIHERSSKWLIAKQEKIKQMLESKKSHELDGCTFQPDISITSSRAANNNNTTENSSIDLNTSDMQNHLIRQANGRERTKSKEIVFHAEPNVYNWKNETTKPISPTLLTKKFVNLSEIELPNPNLLVEQVTSRPGNARELYYQHVALALSKGGFLNNNNNSKK